MPKSKSTRTFGGQQRQKSLKRPDWYDAIPGSREKRAKISNAMAQGPARRSAMARKAARTRKRRGH